MKYIDLHTHTWFSDGGLSPTALVEKAKGLGLSALAITDHDTIKGVGEALSAGAKNSLEIIPGVEISTDFADKDTHIVGLFLDIANQKLTTHLESEGIQRENKALSMVKGFQELGYELDYDQIRSSVKGSIGRPHLAYALITNPANKEQLLRDFGEEVSSTQKIFEKYLGGDCEFYQKYAHVESTISTQEAIVLIHQAGGLAFLAHPHWDYTNVVQGVTSFVGDETIKEIRDFGLDGIEAINFRENLEVSKLMNRHYTDLAKDLGLLISGGSDFHGFGNAGKSLGLIEENVLIDYDILSRMKARLGVV